MQMQPDSTLQHLLGDFSDKSLPEIEYFISQLSALAVRKRTNDAEKRAKLLLKKITQTVLPEVVLDRYVFLQQKMEVETLTDMEYAELLQVVAQEEKTRNKRFQYLLELSQLRNITLPQLMRELGFTTPAYA